MRATKLRSTIALAAVIPLLAAGPAGCGGGDDEEEPAPIGATGATGAEGEADGEIDGGEAIRGPDVEGTEPRGSEDEPTPGTDPPE